MKSAFLKCLVISAILSALPIWLYAQSNTERATQEVDRLGRQIKEKSIPAPARPTELRVERFPPEKEDRRIFVKKIILDGCETCPIDIFQPLIDKYEGREVSFSELDTLIKEIIGEYIKIKIVADAFLYPREEKDGIVTIRIVEAKMGELRVEGNGYFKDKNLIRYWKIAPGEILRYDRISKCVQMMNKNRDREVTAVLRAGSKPGTTDILLRSKTRPPLHIIYNIDNDGTTYTGIIRHITGIRHNNLLGLDDVLAAGYSFGKNYAGVYVFHNVPVSSSGTSFLYGYTRSVAIPKGDFEPFDMRAKTESIRGSLRQDIYNNDKYLGEAYCEFEANDKTVTANTGTLERSRLRMVNVGGTFLKSDAGCVTYIMPEFSQGLGMAFGSSPDENPYAPNLAKPIFSKLSLGAYHRGSLPFGIQDIVKLKGQYSPAKLTPQEQLGFGGMNSIRGYPPGDYYADNGLLANMELLLPTSVLPKIVKLPYAKGPLRDVLKALIFVDYGYGCRRDEDKSHSFLSAGAGLRMRLYDQATIRIEWGFPMWAERSDSRFYFSVDFQDQFPEELARIGKIFNKQKPA